MAALSPGGPPDRSRGLAGAKGERVQLEWNVHGSVAGRRNWRPRAATWLPAGPPNTTLALGPARGQSRALGAPGSGRAGGNNIITQTGDMQPGPRLRFLPGPARPRRQSDARLISGGGASLAWAGRIR